MNDLQQAAEMALKALKNKTTVYVRFDDGVVEATEVLEEALRDALTEPENDDKTNAHLIAAAPELYEALKYCIRQVPDFVDVRQVSVAFKKARGE